MRRGRHAGKPGIWGEVRCLVCSSVILALKGNRTGLYHFKKIAEHPGGQGVAQKKRQERTKRNGDARPKFWLFYCETCGAVRSLGIEDMVQDTVFPKNGIWGDMVCMTCFSIIASVKAYDAGIYTFTKIGELPEEYAKS
jgi:hypothetical protein